MAAGGIARFIAARMLSQSGLMIFGVGQSSCEDGSALTAERPTVKDVVADTMRQRDLRCAKLPHPARQFVAWKRSAAMLAEIHMARAHGSDLDEK